MRVKHFYLFMAAIGLLAPYYRAVVCLTSLLVCSGKAVGSEGERSLTILDSHLEIIR